MVSKITRKSLLDPSSKSPTLIMVRTLIIIICGGVSIISSSAVEPFGNRNFGTGPNNQDAIEEHDLLQAIRVPFDDPRNQFFDSGLDGFPSYGLREGADIKSHYRLFLPDRLYRDFALLVTVKPDRRDISYLFAVVNPLDTLVQFGLKISPSLTSSQNVISLLYTDHSSHLVTQTLTSFEVPLMTKRWNRFSLKVVGDNITLYFNCKAHSSKLAMRTPKELVFDTASTLYIGQAGPILKGNFQGAIQDLKLYGMPGVAEVQCDDSFTNFSSGESSGDFPLVDENDWNDIQYDYPDDNEADYEEIEMGSSPPLPPIIPGPPPPPSSSVSTDFSAINKLAFSATKGMKGDKGDTGPRGPPGPNGQKGERGPPGEIPLFRNSGSGSGAEVAYTKFDPFDTGGQCTCNYTDIVNQLSESFRGPPGLPGPVGPIGPTGLRGPQGEQGLRGLTGPEGPKGMKGETGQKGERGLPGLSMAPNALGYDPDWRPRGMKIADQVAGVKPGPKGDPGLPGEKGERGHPGEKGERGFIGPKGHPGSPGVDGLPGPPGKDGRDGEMGPIGPPGSPGPPGDVANLIDPSTFTALKGEKGDSGNPGKRGRRGKPGPPGLPGPPGEIGPPGWPGRPGLSITGPKGDKGDSGQLPEGFYNYEIHGISTTQASCPTTCPPGPPGPRGPPGIPGISIVGEPGIGIPGHSSRSRHAYTIDGHGGGINALRAKLTETNSPPGYPGPKGEPGVNSGSGSSSKLVPGAVVFLTKEAMLKQNEGKFRRSKRILISPENLCGTPISFVSLNRNQFSEGYQDMSDMSSVGTIAFVKSEEKLYLRISNGWKEILLGDFISAPEIQMKPQQDEMTTEPARLMRFPEPFQASSLVNRIEGPSLRLVALNDPWNGDMHGIRGADYSCYRQARNSNLLGTFRAFLVSYVQNLDSIVKYTDRNLPIVSLKGDVLFNSWSDIFTGTGKTLSRPPQVYSFNGRNVIQDIHWPQKMIWHGSGTEGVRAKAAYCEAWHSDSPSNVGLASDLLKGQVLGQESIGCHHKLIVLCIEIASHHNTYQRRRREAKPTATTINTDTENELLNKILDMNEYSELLNDYDSETSNGNNINSNANSDGNSI